MCKKSELITFRTTAGVKTLLQALADSKEISVSNLVNEICREYLSKRMGGE